MSEGARGRALRSVSSINRTPYPTYVAYIALSLAKGVYSSASSIASSQSFSVCLAEPERGRLNGRREVGHADNQAVGHPLGIGTRTREARTRVLRSAANPASLTAVRRARAAKRP